MFPSLKSLEVPLQSLAAPHLVKDSSTHHDDLISEQEIDSIRDSFPASLTALTIPSTHSSSPYKGTPRIIQALGAQLRSYSHQYLYGNKPPSSVIKWLPKWENPCVDLSDVVLNMIPASQDIVEGQDLAENKNFDKISLSLPLYRSATSLDTSILPASTISLLPKSLTSLRFLVAPPDSLLLENSLVSASEASTRLESNAMSIDSDEDDIKNPKSSLGRGIQLSWPTNLTRLCLELRGGSKPLHFGCLPATVRELYLVYSKTPQPVPEGRDLSHLKELSVLSLDTDSVALITSLHGLPRSLRAIMAPSGSIADEVFEDPDFQNFFNLEQLSVSSIDVLLHLPRSLRALYVDLKPEGRCLSEKHFEGISRCPKLALLVLSGGVKWPDDLSFNVFCKYLPFMLATLSLNLSDLIENSSEQDLASHIPVTLLDFYSSSVRLSGLVKARISAYQSANNPS